MIPNTKYVFLGTPEFAAFVLEGLIKGGFPPSLVITNPDRPVGRKKLITAPPAKEVAQKNGIPLWQPEKLDSNEYKSRVTGFDFAVVAAYAKILRQEVLVAPRLGTIGVHPSLLPKYRGASPIQSAILADETTTGVTLFMLDERVDHGPIIASIKYQVSSIENYETLMKKLAGLSADLLLETLPKFIDGKITPQPQNETFATYTKKFQTQDGFVDLADLALASHGASLEKAEMIARKVRALNPEPGVYTMKDGKRMKILEANLENGKLILKKIQFNGEKPKTTS